jgi:hypothetical protein
MCQIKKLKLANKTCGCSIFEQSRESKVVKTPKHSQQQRYTVHCIELLLGLTLTFKLTNSTWEALSSGVAIEILPRTMQDAINFTRDINVDWLWIDSLCIFQDSQEDWNREALTMRQVYRDAFLVIAALGAASGDEGLFAIRDPLLYSPCFLFQTEQGEDIDGGQVSTLGLVMDAWPLHQRGWVVQERTDLAVPRKTRR